MSTMVRKSVASASAHSELCQTSNKELLRIIARAAGSTSRLRLIVTVNQVEVFSQNNTHLVTGFN